MDAAFESAVAQCQAGNPWPFITGYLKVRTKDNQIVTFALNAVQDYARRQLTGVDYIIKPRQAGFSTLNLARAFAPAVCIPYFNAAAVTISTDEGKTRQRMFKTIATFIEQMEEKYQPKTRHMQDDFVEFENGSQLYVGTAGSRQFGRSDTIHFLMLSEIPHWQDAEAESVLTSSMESVPLGGTIICETTPGKLGSYAHGLWVDAKEGKSRFHPIFIPWFWHTEYALAEGDADALPRDRGPIDLADDERDIARLFPQDGIPVADRIRWRRLKRAERKEIFFSEYPEDEVSCWHVTLANVFSVKHIRQMMAGVLAPLRSAGDVIYWKEPNPSQSYVVCGDAAEGIVGRDYSAGVVLSVQSGEHVARIHGYLAPDAFARGCVDLAAAYNGAKLGFLMDARGRMCAQAAVSRLGYGNMYRHRDFDRRTEGPGNYGLPETHAHKAQMVAGLRQAVEDGEFRTYDKELLQELLEYQRFEGDKFGAPPGRHDDLVAAAMGAHQMRLVQPMKPAMQAGANQRVVAYPAGVL